MLEAEWLATASSFHARQGCGFKMRADVRSGSYN